MAGKQQPTTELETSVGEKSPKRLVTLIGAGMLLGGAGFAGYAVAQTHGPGRANPDLTQPRLQTRDGTSKSSLPAGETSDTAIDPMIYKPSYYPLQEPFTSNLADSGAIVQANIGFGTFYDNKVLDNIKDNEVAIRSLVLATLASEDADALATPKGKQLLLSDIRGKVNNFLIHHTGYGGVEGAYFTNLVVQ